MTDRELMQMANRIEALAFEMKAPNAHTPQFVMLANEIRARARLAQPEPEPVAYDVNGATVYIKPPIHNGKYLTGYAAPPQREWQGLTDEEVIKLGGLDKDSDYFGLWYDFARAIEAKLKEKNNG